MEPDELGRTETFHAISEKDFERFQNLIETEKDIDISDINGMNLLHFACVYELPEVAKVLIEKGIDINHTDKHGNNPLWTSTINYKGYPEKMPIVRLLLSNGANPHSKNRVGRSPLDFAKQVGFDELVEVLESKEQDR